MDFSSKFLIFKKFYKMKNPELKQFLSENPHYQKGNYEEVAKRFNVSYDVVRKTAKKLREEIELPSKQIVETPEGYKGVLKSAKTWQLPNGDWRESLQFEVDNSQDLFKFKEELLKELSLLGSLNNKPKTIKKTNNEVLLEISCPDLHFGKGSLEEISNSFIVAVWSLVEKAEKFGIDRILLPIGNDALNSEGKRRTTTGGTPQEDSGPWYQTFRHYISTMIATIQMLSEYYPVDVLVVPGNHDHEVSFYAGEAIRTYFHSNTNVQVNNNYGYRKYYEYGVNMLLFTHGDSEKTSDLPLIMATEQPEMFARTKFRETHLGHFHKEMLNEFRGVKVRFLPALCKADDWHTKMGYEAMKAAQAYLWNKKDGLEGYFQYNG